MKSANITNNKQALEPKMASSKQGLTKQKNKPNNATETIQTLNQKAQKVGIGTQMEPITNSNTPAQRDTGQDAPFNQNVKI